MEIYLVPLVAFLASLLTFFSGFGLGTLLTPVFALFAPASLAVAQTSIVHFFNNLFKIFLIARNVDRSILIRFGLTALAGSGLGAWALIYVANLPPLMVYFLGERECIITPIKLVIGVLIIAFSIAELLPYFSKAGFGKGNLYLGGLISGFFGGLSGHQGALRSAFLIRYQLSKEAYVATGTAIALIIDLVRIGFYIRLMSGLRTDSDWRIIVLGTGAAFLGALTGNFLLKKITLTFIQHLTHALLIIIGTAMLSGII